MSTADAGQAATAEFVTFSAGGQSFSLAIASVREIRRWSPVTALPHAPKGVLGVMNLRGAVIPIYDLAQRFGLDATADSARNVVVIAMDGARTVGLLVESVSEILSVAPAAIQTAPELRGEAARAGITGLIPLEDGLTRVIDLSAVLGPREARAA